ANTSQHSILRRFHTASVVVALFANGVNGVAACRMQREMDVSYKSAFVLLHKIRKIMGSDEDAAQLGGVVEIDGTVFGGSVQRLPNEKALWKEFIERNKAAARKKRRLIVVIRERQAENADGPGKVRTFLLNKEGDAIEIARRMVMPDAILHADFSTQWEPLHLHFETRRINHSESYSKDGACTNMAESFFSRMRTAERGVHKILSGAHLARYAMEMGWREQYRRRSNKTQFEMIIGAVGRSKPSTTFLGYWRKRAGNDNGLFDAVAS
ncbi:IS1595 family transposase, partial [uncultured Sphingomonas sp.]